ncbi:MAG: ABC transporter ATP-binding protein [Desulfovibrio sp.]|jgi:branched-chain amino acid transport system ATP-binding protein|nr:ABC transporter ATP-binding protein [Desulfovibrio sp.]
MRDSHILTTENLSLSYGSFRAVDKVNLRVRSRTVHSVIGPNGAGKTSLFHCLTGGRRPTGGRILFKGEEITNSSAHARVGSGMARSFQVTSLFQNLTVRENLRLAAQGRDGNGALVFWRSVNARKEHAALADGIMERLGLDGKAGVAAGDLSHGQQRLLEVGMALCGKPELLLLDEPTAGMGVNDIPMMTELIAGLGKEYSVMLIEHNMGIVMAVSDTITVMSRGGVLVEGKPEAVRADPRVREAYLGEVA